MRTGAEVSWVHVLKLDEDGVGLHLTGESIDRIECRTDDAVPKVDDFETGAGSKIRSPLQAGGVQHDAPHQHGVIGHPECTREVLVIFQLRVSPSFHSDHLAEKALCAS